MCQCKEKNKGFQRNPGMTEYFEKPKNKVITWGIIGLEGLVLPGVCQLVPAGGEKDQG